MNANLVDCECKSEIALLFLKRMLVYFREKLLCSKKKKENRSFIVFIPKLPYFLTKILLNYFEAETAFLKKINVFLLYFRLKFPRFLKRKLNVD